jgi:outer membrane protease
MKTWTVQILSLLLVSMAFSQESVSGLRMGLDAGYRTDRGQWTISGGEDGPNIISDLEWKELEIYELRLRGEYSVGRIVLDGSLGYGVMVNGKNRDSDYAFDDRQGEFSRSLAETEGNTLDMTVSAGMPFTVSDSDIILTPFIGYGVHHQNHTDTDGIQIVDDPGLEALLDGIPSDLGPEDGNLGPFDGLDSTYDAEWTGPYIGLHAQIPVRAKGLLKVQYQFYVIDYYADLYWNLRDLPFENEADGTGHAISVAYQHVLKENALLTLEGSYTSFETDEGIQTDPGGDIDLNGAEWESIGFRIGAIFLL